jgi:hypothetical protein
VPDIKELKDKILCAAHESAYSIHPGGIRSTMITMQPIGVME